VEGRILCVYLNCLLRINSLAIVTHVILFTASGGFGCYTMTSLDSPSEWEAEDEQTGTDPPYDITFALSVA
jgi:hypothetical protein